MGWDIMIRTDRPMTGELISEIIDKDVPRSLARGCGKLEWGWSIAVDVRLEDSETLWLSGSFGVSGKIAELAAECFARHLERRGYSVKIGEMH